MTRQFPQSGYDPVTGEWNDSLKGDYGWSNVNFGEAVPDVMTPSTWSLLWIYINKATPDFFPGGIPLGGNIAGRFYFNLSLLPSLYHAFGIHVRQDTYHDLMGSMSAELDLPLIPVSRLAILWHTPPRILYDRIQTRRDLRQLPSYLISLADWRRTTQPKIQPCSDAPGLLSLWTESFMPTILRSNRVLRSVTVNFSNPANKLKSDLLALVGEAEATTLLSNLAGASGDLESLGPLIGLARVKAGQMSREQVIERYGHRGPHEVELSAPVPSDDPEWLDKKLADFVQSGVDVDALLARQRAEFAVAWQRFEKRFPNKTQAFRRRLALVAEAAKDREAFRSETIRLSQLIRRFLLRVGEVMEIGDDIFFLTLDEMMALLAGDRQALGVVSARRDMVRRCCALPPYPSIIYGRFDPFKWAADPNRRSDFYDARQTGTAPMPSAIKGFAGAAGCAEGTVRRIDRLEDANQVQPGEILVTTITNVGWTPLFPRLSAIVTDVGAPLSHAAIVARELGIPAVVGCGNATMLLKTGDRVRVDGGRGTAEILTRAGTA